MITRFNPLMNRPGFLHHGHGLGDDTPSLSISGLVSNAYYSNFALVGSNPSVSSNGTPVDVRWGVSQFDVDNVASLGTGNSPTDMSVVDSGDPDNPTILWLRSTVFATIVYDSVAIRAAAPVNTVLPALNTTGNTTGDTVSLTQGTWTAPGSTVYTRRIYVDGTLVATNADYVIQSGDDGLEITGEVEAVTSGGLVLASATGSFFVVGTYAPINTAAPVASGSHTIGSTLSVTNGSWNANPAITGYTYQWRRNGSPISGATSNTYTVVVADDAASVDCVVTATNPVGSTGQASNAIVIDDVYAPSNTGAPVASGSNTIGSLLSVTNGTWDANPAISGYTYQWRRNGSPIGGATSNTYTIVVADDAANVDCVVTATNIVGSTAQASNAITVEDISAPVITGVPTISGTIALGETLTANPASVSGNPTPTRTWQWFRSGTPVSGATGTTYVLSESDSGFTMTVRQTETNTYGVDNATSAATTTVPYVQGTQTQQVSNVPRFIFSRVPMPTQEVSNVPRFIFSRVPMATQQVSNMARFTFVRKP